MEGMDPVLVVEDADKVVEVNLGEGVDQARHRGHWPRYKVKVLSWSRDCSGGGGWSWSGLRC